MSWTALCQPSTPDSIYCLPLKTARALVADALRLQVSDSLNTVLSAQVDLLQAARLSDYHSFTNLLKIEQEKFETQKEITADFVRLADSWREEATYYQKRYKKQRRQKGVLTIGAMGLLVLMILK